MANPNGRLVVADVGNHQTKIALVDRKSRQTRLLEYRLVRDPSELSGPFLDSGPFDWYISSVNQHRLCELTDWIEQRQNDPINPSPWNVLKNSDIPLVCQVKFPERVGTDRLLAAFGATQQLGDHMPIIVIDSGTAVTIDLVKGASGFCGGMIFPGLNACLEKLAESTAQLPKLIFQGQKIDLIGTDTESAILSGVYHMQLGAILSAVERIKCEHGPCQVITTGGGIRAMLGQFPASWIFEPNLVLNAIAHLAVGHR